MVTEQLRGAHGSTLQAAPALPNSNAVLHASHLCLQISPLVVQCSLPINTCNPRSVVQTAALQISPLVVQCSSAPPGSSALTNLSPLSYLLHFKKLQVRHLISTHH